jgi:hypothetical protein
MTVLIFLTAITLTFLFCGSIAVLADAGNRSGRSPFAPGTGRHRRPGPARILPSLGGR